MSDATVPSLEAEGLSVFPKVTDRVMSVLVAGAVEMRDPGDLLNPYWTQLDDDARRLGVSRVELDLRDLTFMNSSGLLTLVRWITKVKTHANDSYQMILCYDRNVTWQRASIPTLAKLAPDLVTATDTNG